MTNIITISDNSRGIVVELKYSENSDPLTLIKKFRDYKPPHCEKMHSVVFLNISKKHVKNGNKTIKKTNENRHCSKRNNSIWGVLRDLNFYDSITFKLH